MERGGEGYVCRFYHISIVLIPVSPLVQVTYHPRKLAGEKSPWGGGRRVPKGGRLEGVGAPKREERRSVPMIFICRSMGRRGGTPHRRNEELYPFFFICRLTGRRGGTPKREGRKAVPMLPHWSPDGRRRKAPKREGRKAVPMLFHWNAEERGRKGCAQTSSLVAQQATEGAPKREKLCPLASPDGSQRRNAEERGKKSWAHASSLVA